MNRYLEFYQILQTACKRQEKQTSL